MTVRKIGKFQVLETLGSGAHSHILRIRRNEDHAEYALKVIPVDAEEDKKYLDQAKHEFRVGQMLDHPNLVKVYAFETETDWLLRVKKAKLLVEYAPGETLDKARLLNMGKMLRVLEKVASALVYMHRQGVYHADLKPNNIILGPRMKVKVLDYGLARIKDDPPRDRVQGTLEYMAPETASHKIINERTDIYNFGATMYRLTTFKLPPPVVPDAGGITVERKDGQTGYVPVIDITPSVPKALSDLIGRCLEQSALRRPERMSEVQGLLDRLADEYVEKHGPIED